MAVLVASEADKFRAQLRKDLSWLPDALFNIYYRAYIDNNRDPNLALEAVRDSPAYDRFFAGNKRDDGSIRWNEQRYLSITESFADTLRLAGVNPDRFRHRFGELIAGNKSPDEFAMQVEQLVSRVMLDAPEVLRNYSEFWGVDMTRAGLIAAALDPDLSDQLLNKQISMAEVAAEGVQRGFRIDKGFAARLFNADLDEEGAATFFGNAGQWVPVLNTLAKRHADPDDDFDLEEFSQSEIFDDPEQRLRMRRLVNQERATYISPGGFGVSASQDTGGLTGLGNR